MQTTENVTETHQHDNQSPIIAALNDRFRQTYWGGKVMTTSGVKQLINSRQSREYDDEPLKAVDASLV